MIQVKSILIGGSVKGKQAEKLMQYTGSNQMLINGMTKLLNCDLAFKDKKEIEQCRLELQEISSISKKFIYFNYTEK